MVDDKVKMIATGQVQWNIRDEAGETTGRSIPLSVVYLLTKTNRLFVKTVWTRYDKAKLATVTLDHASWVELDLPDGI